MLSQVLAILLFILFITSPIALDEFESLTVWNVGQGQWATYRDSQSCLHFDAGGEKAPLRKIMIHCEGRRNFLFLSHDDFDHIRYTPWLVQKLHACWFTSESQKKFFKRLKVPIPNCDELQNLPQLVYAPTAKAKSANMQSFIYSHHGILFPGDAPSASEKIWSGHRLIKSTRILMLGHHGSKTSSSELLLKNLNSLKMSVASSRRSRYGHPHFEILLRMRSHNVPALSTEDWGNIQFYF